MRTISLRRLKRAPEHFVLFEGNLTRHKNEREQDGVCLSNGFERKKSAAIHISTF